MSSKKERLPQVHVNGKWLGSAMTGTQRYAKEIVRGLLSQFDGKDCLVLHVPKNADVPPWLADNCKIVRHRSTGISFEQLSLPFATWGRLLLNFGGPAPILKRNQLVVMHDAGPMRFPGSYSKIFVLWYWLLYVVLSRRARYLVTVSEFSRRELARALRITEERFFVAHCGHEHFENLTARRPELPYTFHAETHFVICVGTLAAHKNLLNPVRRIAEAGWQVLIIGSGGPSRVFAEIKQPLPERAFVLGRITDEELAWCYDRATALIFPSKYEGFGLPIIEAQSRSCPVIASDAASIPEVGGTAALYFPPDDLDEILIHLNRLRVDNKERIRLGQAGKKNANRFRWSLTAAAIVQLLGSG
jgi:glycosyltransferase involved in cell wall biosynthesis